MSKYENTSCIGDKILVSVLIGIHLLPCVMSYFAFNKSIFNLFSISLSSFCYIFTGFFIFLVCNKAEEVQRPFRFIILWAPVLFSTVFLNDHRLARFVLEENN